MAIEGEMSQENVRLCYKRCRSSPERCGNAGKRCLETGSYLWGNVLTNSGENKPDNSDI